MKKLSLLVISVLLLVLLAGCTGTTAEETSSSGESGPLEAVTLVLDWVPNTNHTGLYAALENGYYEDQGLDVEIVQPSVGGSADLIAAGQGEFGISYQEQVTIARTTTDPLPVKAIAAIIQHNTSGFASPSDKNINRPKDFEGKKYGGWGLPSEAAMLKGLMEKDGGDFSKVEMVNVDSLDFFTAVKDHVDFTWIYYGWDGVAAEGQDYPINFIKLQELEPALDCYTPTIIASEKLLSEKPELAKKFLKATAKGYDFAIDQPEKAADILVKYVPELDLDMVIASQTYLAKEYQADAPRWGEMTATTWATYGAWLFDNDLLESQLDVDQAFSNDFLPE